MVPHLTTALTGPLLALEETLLLNQGKIEHWFRQQWQEYSAPFYASVDLRNAGFKLAPVDTNLFPAGFNNLNPEFRDLCVQAVMVAVEKICPDAHRLLLIPENHTRNPYYFHNIATLIGILEQAGMKVRVGSISPEIKTPTVIPTLDGQSVLLEPVVRVGNRLQLHHDVLGKFDSCAILLNNDLSAGVPELLENLEQSLIPPLYAGWHWRRKSEHFLAYNRAVADFAQQLGIDTWLINPDFETCDEMDFHSRKGEDCLAHHVDVILKKTTQKYAEYGVTQKPFVIVKANAGTYGMGIMTVKSPDDVRGLNRKTRNKMAVVKDGLAVREVLVQEGVYTFESINGAVAEPVVYMIDHFVIGGFYRVHTTRDVDENLNAPGAHFVPLAFEESCHLPICTHAPDSPPNRFYAYGVIARLALLAAAMELQSYAKALCN